MKQHLAGIALLGITTVLSAVPLAQLQCFGDKKGFRIDDASKFLLQASEILC